MRRSISALIAVLILISMAVARLTVTGDPASAQPAAVSEAETRIRASDSRALENHVDREVTVYGRVRDTNKSRSGHQFLNFYNADLTVICRDSDVDNFKAGEPARLYRAKDVEISGKLERYKGKLQIQLRLPTQIRIVDPKSSSAGAPVQLQQIAKDRWISPAGLVYQGYDPAGLTRVEHIERHARDFPSRPGPHGVFDGGSEAAFGVIDEAWKTAQTRGLRAKQAGGTSSLIEVALGRRIGYLGGTVGKRKSHPPLSRVRIVYQTGTKNIVTAFPF